jgi:hypothetical protein
MGFIGQDPKKIALVGGFWKGSGTVGNFPRKTTRRQLEKLRLRECRHANASAT